MSQIFRIYASVVDFRERGTWNVDAERRMRNADLNTASSLYECRIDS